MGDIYSIVLGFFIPQKTPGLFRQRTIPTERQPLVGEDSANFSG
jgi:hypothetical protein